LIKGIQRYGLNSSQTFRGQSRTGKKRAARLAGLAVLFG